MTSPKTPRRSPARAVIVTSLVVTLVQAIAFVKFAVTTGQYIVLFGLVVTTPLAAVAGALAGALLHWIAILARNRRRAASSAPNAQLS
jgi:hypothetical protein